jgi:FlaG/FlaF family flagellin (archaellin)
MIRLAVLLAALVAAFLAGATAQANWPVRAAWEDNL